MKLVVQESERKQEILLVDEKFTPLGKILKEELKKYDSTVYVSPHLPAKTDRFAYIFIVNKRREDLTLSIQKKKWAEELTSFVRSRRLGNVKIVSVNSPYLDQSDLEKLFWFSFSKSREVFFKFDDRERHSKEPVVKKQLTPLRNFPFFTKKQLFLLFLLLFVLYHLLIFPPLFLSSFFIYRSAQTFKDGQLDKAKQTLKIAENLENTGKAFYSFSRPSYLLFSLALFSDTLVDVNDKAIETLDKTYISYENSRNIMSLVFEKGKTEEEKGLLEARLAKLKENISDIKNNLIFLDQKLADLPFGLANTYRKDLSKSVELIVKADNILPFTDKLLAKGKEMKYLLLFANNMELRPGGGFIGSFGE